MTTATTESCLRAFGRRYSWLTPSERARLSRLCSPQERDDFLAAHLLVRVCAGSFIGIPPSNLTIVQRCETCAGDHGSPSLAEASRLGVSWSHSRGHVAVAVGAPPVGVDVEVANESFAGDELEIGNVVLCPDEARLLAAAPDRTAFFLQLWTCKEALVKAEATTLGELAAVSLVDDCGDITRRWGDLHVATWIDRAGVVTSSATRDRAVVRALDEVTPPSRSRTWSTASISRPFAAAQRR